MGGIQAEVEGETGEAARGAGGRRQVEVVAEVVVQVAKEQEKAEKVAPKRMAEARDVEHFDALHYARMR